MPRQKKYAAETNLAPYAAPSMDAIPISKRRRVLDGALGRYDNNAEEAETGEEGSEGFVGGHERARNSLLHSSFASTHACCTSTR
mmetsp:Transcript_39960/g.68177  ORF Transcript_39960/g.68177 Transcript_39960/m.68177 type:complete len:85 (+) Transcript_39960:32-286(+)